MKAAVIGNPITHSLSPSIFKFISNAEGLRLDYGSKEISQTGLHDFLKSITNEKDFVGVNITLPHKESALTAIVNASTELKLIGAINVIKVVEGSLHGFNTDVIGIEKTLSSHHFSVKDRSCFLFGAGGSAKAVAYVLGKQGAKEVYFYNPRSNRAEEMIKKFSAVFKNTFFKNLKSVNEVSTIPFSLLINTTPVGMFTAFQKDKNNTTESNDLFNLIDNLTFASSALAFDLIYTPSKTPFLIKAATKGLKTLSGLEMLIEQAMATWEIWFKPIKNEKVLRDSLSAYLRGLLALRRNATPVYLTGFMGVGKSSVAKELSLLTNRIHLDTDQMIEASTKASIQEIFKAKGETVFRELEIKAVLEASKKQQSVVSLGGGALIDSNNLNILISTGTLVFLTADEITLNRRISDQQIDRPLFSGLSNDERLTKIKSLLSDRMHHYTKAKIIISTLNKSPLEVAFEIVSKLGEQNA